MSLPIMLKWDWFVVAVMLLACALGARGLDYDTIWTDEFYSLRDAGLLERLTGERIDTPSTVHEIWDRVATGNPWHTPLFFVVLSGWSRLVGFDPAVLRVIALFFGLLTLAWTYRLGRDLMSPQVGAFAAIVLGTSAYFIYYFHEIRMYTVVTMFTAYLFWVYFQVVSRRGSLHWLWWLGLFAGAALFPYSHYFATLPIGAIGIFHLAVGYRLLRRNGVSPRRWWGVVAVFVAAGVLYLPWVSVLMDGISRTLDDEVLQSLALDSPQAMLWMFNLFSNGALWLLAALVLLAALALRRRQVQYVFLLCILLMGMVVLANELLEIFKPSRIRYMILIWPLLALVVAVGMLQVRRWRLVPPLLLGLWVTGNLTGAAVPEFFSSVDAATYVYPLQEVAHYVRPRAQPDDYVLSYVPEDLRMARYDRLANYYFSGITNRHRNLGMIYESDRTMDALHDEAIRSLDGAERVWFAYMPADVPETFAEFRDELDLSYDVCSVWQDENQVEVALFTRSPVCCIPDAAPPQPMLHFGNWFTVVGTQLYETIDNTMVDAVIAWQQAADAPLHAYSATIQLFDASGNRVAQADYGLEPAAYACRRATLDVEDLKPGTYQARLAVYNWQTGERLAATDLQTGALGDMLPLATITIES